MAIAFKWGNSHNGAGGTISGTSVVIGDTNKFTSNGAVAAGDLLIATLILCDEDDPGEPDVPGFAALQTNFSVLPFTINTRAWVGYKVATASDTGLYPASWLGDADGVGWCLLNFSGVDGESPIDTSAYLESLTAEHQVPSITPSRADTYWLAISARGGANAPDTPRLPLIGLYDANGNDVGARPEISAAGVQLASSAATGIGIFDQFAFAQASHGFSIGLATTPVPALVEEQPGGAGELEDDPKRRRTAQLSGPASKPVPLAKLYKPAEFFDFEEDDVTVVLLTV